MRAPLRRPHLGVVLLALCPGPLAALQLGASLDVGTGPARWDQVESESARVQGNLGGSYRPLGFGRDAWFRDHCRVVVILDRDDDDCRHLKKEIEAMAKRAGLATRGSAPSRPSARRFGGT